GGGRTKNAGLARGAVGRATVTSGGGGAHGRSRLQDHRGDGLVDGGDRGGGPAGGVEGVGDDPTVAVVRGGGYARPHRGRGDQALAGQGQARVHAGGMRRGPGPRGERHATRVGSAVVA